MTPAESLAAREQLRAKLAADVQEIKRFARPDGSVRIGIRVDARTEPGVPYLEIARLNVDGSTRASQAFHREELRELREAIERARCLTLGAEEASENARAQEAAGLRPAKRGKR